MAPSDPKQGGDLFDMAAQGTQIPGDAGKMNTIPSVPRPGQGTDSNDLGAEDLAGAADNATDIPRSARDQGNVEQPITGAGDTLPATIDSKRLHNVPGGVTNDPGAKGSTRATEHARQKPDVEVGASDGPGVQTPIGLEEQSVDAQRDAVDSKQI